MVNKRVCVRENCCLQILCLFSNDEISHNSTLLMGNYIYILRTCFGKRVRTQFFFYECGNDDDYYYSS